MAKLNGLNFGIMVLMVCASAGFVAGAEKGPERWEGAIQRFEAADRESPPAEGGVLFIGSSSIRGWDLERSFPELGAINRGFGGSQIEDSTYYAERIIFPYRPRTIVLYAGDNDIADGESPAEVFADFKKFVRTVREELPDTRIIFIAIKPSLPDSPAGRWDMAPEMSLANAMVRSYTRRRAGLVYADIFTPMLGEDGRPRRELFAGDGLHLSEKGYEVWAEVMRPMLHRSESDDGGAGG